VPRLDIRPTTYDEVADTAAHLFAEHWQETARNKAVMVLQPDAGRYRALEAQGSFFALGAFVDGELVGYSGNLIGPHLHYADLRYSTNDVLFVSEAHRKSSLGLKLIDATEREARRRGARMVLWHAKEGTALAAIMPKRGCAVQDIIFSRELEPSNFVLLGDEFDPVPALVELDGNPLWDAFTARQDTPGSPHHDTRCIVLRGPRDITAESVFNDLEAVDYPTVEQLPEVLELARQAVTRIGVKTLGRVMLAELKAGGHIDRHFDDGAYAAHYERFHLVLQSDAGNTFINGEECIHMAPGELWQFSHRKEHEVHNDSTRTRVHLIIDAVRG
jgi:GNAT superfamily N-acetyltransferase